MVYIFAIAAILLACTNIIKFLAGAYNLHPYKVLDSDMSWFVEIGDKYITRGEVGLGLLNKSAAVGVDSYSAVMVLALVAVTVGLLTQTAKFTVNTK
ncbi:hypothetical protein [Vibrio crassostreae]|uniref:hypothetical protein n=1 Tax=Vibrio crassostreae TaxID=246167 RepID=UPI001B30FD50|nr:hypothetical protein [Vibrio crassostreae]